jgi:hypothetical protein
MPCSSTRCTVASPAVMQTARQQRESAVTLSKVISILIPWTTRPALTENGVPPGDCRLDRRRAGHAQNNAANAWHATALAASRHYRRSASLNRDVKLTSMGASAPLRGGSAARDATDERQHREHHEHEERPAPLHRIRRL